MTPVLLSSHLHGSSIFVTQTFANDGSLLVHKSSYSKSDFNSITSEFKGFTWYTNLHKLDALENSTASYRFSQNYAKVTLPYINGALLSSFDLDTMFSQMKQAVYHYIQIWSLPGCQNYLHGDLSCENIIITDDNNVFFIDWEHSAPNSVFFGFDAIHLILETLILVYNSGNLCSSHLRDSASSLNIILSHPLYKSCNIDNPFHSVRFFMEKNLFLWSPQVTLCKSKFPVISVDRTLLSSLFSLLRPYLL